MRGDFHESQIANCQPPAQARWPAGAGEKFELEILPPPGACKPQRGDIFVVRQMKMNSSSVRSDMVAVRKDYAAPTGLENFVGGSATKISLLTELDQKIHAWFSKG